MDWFSWLSRTNLEPTLVYQYGLSLTHNELEHQDIRYFNHEFLQSIGISIAKHRIEILNLVKKEKKSFLLAPKSVSRILIAIKQTRNCLAGYLRGRIRGEKSSQALMVMPWDASKRSNTKKVIHEKDNQINGLNQERLLLTDGSFGISRVHHDEDEDEDDANWGKGLEEIKWDSMFQDLKPT